MAQKRRMISQRRGRFFWKPTTNNKFLGRVPIFQKYHREIHTTMLIRIKTLWYALQRLNILKYYCSRQLDGTAGIGFLISSAAQHIPDGADELVVCRWNFVTSCCQLSNGLFLKISLIYKDAGDLIRQVWQKNCSPLAYVVRLAAVC